MLLRLYLSTKWTGITWDMSHMRLPGYQLGKTQQQKKRETARVEMRCHNNILQSPWYHVALSIVLCASCFWKASDSCSSKLATLKHSTSFNSTCGARLAELILQLPRIQQFGSLAEENIAPCVVASGLSATRPAAPTTSCAWGHGEKRCWRDKMEPCGCISGKKRCWRDKMEPCGSISVSCEQFTSNSRLKDT